MPHCPYHLSRSLLGLLVLSAVAGVSAQDAIMAVPHETRDAPIVRNAAPPPSLSQPPDTGTPFTTGFVQFPSKSVVSLPLFGRPAGWSQAGDSGIQTIAPSFQFDLGQNWALDYAPEWTIYSDPIFKDTVDQAVSLRGAIIAKDWFLQLNEHFGLSSPTLVETAQQTKTRTWLTSLGASHSFTPLIGLQLNASLNENYTEVHPDTREWTTSDWLTFNLFRQVILSVGPTLGYVDIVGEPDMTFQRYLGRLNWRPTDKLSFGISGGVEKRQSRASAARDLQNPILDATFDYQPFDTTTLGFSYARTVNTSYFREQVTTGSSWNAHVEQRLLGHFYLSAVWSHRESDYESVTVVVTSPPSAPVGVNPILVSLPGRNDRVDIFHARLTFQFLKRLRFAATYQESKNSSSQSVFSFSSKQYGIELSCRY